MARSVEPVDRSSAPGGRTKALLLDQLDGTAALHNRRVGRYGQHVEHLLIGAHAVAILANLDRLTGAPEDAAAAQRKQADALAMAARDLDGMLRAPVLPVLVGEARRPRSRFLDRARSAA